MEWPSRVSLFPCKLALRGRTLPGLRAPEGTRDDQRETAPAAVDYPLRFQGKPVWIGQISRDIGVRFTLKTWNLTTHKIDPDVDDARDFVLDDLMESGRVARVGYVAGAEASEPTAPRRNLTGDPYFTNGLRAVAIFSETRTTPTFLDWA